MYEIYTDGAASNNRKGEGIGGYAYIILEEQKVIESFKQGKKNTTNNECELLAIITACNKVLEKLDGWLDNVIIYSDSAYCINCYQEQWWKKWQTNGWRNSSKQPVANKELWLQLIPFFEDERFDFQKVEAHQNQKWNTMVDRMAVAAKFDLS